MKKYILSSLFSLSGAIALAQDYKDPAFPGGADSLMRFIARNTTVPDKGELSAEGTLAKAQLIVDRKGKISFVSTLPVSLTDPFSRALVQMIKKMPAWEPGLVNGKKTFTQYAVTGKFHLKQEGDAAVRIFTIDMPPHFPAGDMGMNNFLSEHLKYPREAAENNAGGTVTISLVVKETGEVDNIRVTSTPLGYGLDEEALRVALLMPNWEPAIKDGKKVTMEHNFPIKYTITSQ